MKLQEKKEEKPTVISVECEPDLKEQAQAKAEEKGFKTLSPYVRFLIIQDLKRED